MVKLESFIGSVQTDETEILKPRSPNILSIRATPPEASCEDMFWDRILDNRVAAAFLLPKVSKQKGTRAKIGYRKNLLKKSFAALQIDQHISSLTKHHENIDSYKRTVDTNWGVKPFYKFHQWIVSDEVSSLQTDQHG